MEFLRTTGLNSGEAQPAELEEIIRIALAKHQAYGDFDSSAVLRNVELATHRIEVLDTEVVTR